MPVTYNILNNQIKRWMQQIGENPKSFSTHSLRRGRAILAFKKGVPGETIKLLGDWASNAYMLYIDVTMEERMKAWFHFLSH